jgi:hypothetical protein
LPKPPRELPLPVGIDQPEVLRDPLDSNQRPDGSGNSA